MSRPSLSNVRKHYRSSHRFGGKLERFGPLLLVYLDISISISPKHGHFKCILLTDMLENWHFYSLMYYKGKCITFFHLWHFLKVIEPVSWKMHFSLILNRSSKGNAYEIWTELKLETVIHFPVYNWFCDKKTEENMYSVFKRICYQSIPKNHTRSDHVWWNSIKDVSCLCTILWQLL